MPDNVDVPGLTKIGVAASGLALSLHFEILEKSNHDLIVADPFRGQTCKATADPVLLSRRDSGIEQWHVVARSSTLTCMRSFSESKSCRVARDAARFWHGAIKTDIYGRSATTKDGRNGHEMVMLLQGFTG